MSITFDTPPPHLRRAVSAPHGSSLINRIQRTPLKDRLASDDSQIRDSDGPGPVRSHPRKRGGGPKPSRVPKKPKTAEELDKELDAFMGDSEPVTNPTSTVEAAPASDAKVGNTDDVEMV